LPDLLVIICCRAFFSSDYVATKASFCLLLLLLLSLQQLLPLLLHKRFLHLAPFRREKNLSTETAVLFWTFSFEASEACVVEELT